MLDIERPRGREREIMGFVGHSGQAHQITAAKCRHNHLRQNALRRIINCRSRRRRWNLLFL